MGWFSDDTETVVSTAAMHLVDAGTDPVRDAVLSSLISGSYLTETILEGALSGMAPKIKRAMNYARTTYELRLPSGHVDQADYVDDTEIESAIKIDIGYAYNILVTERSFGPLAPIVVLSDFLLNTRQYNTKTKEVAVWPTGTTFTTIPGVNVNTLPRKVEVAFVDRNPDGLTADITYNLYVFRWVRKQRAPEPGYLEYYMQEEWTFDKTLVENVPIPNLGSLVWGETVLLAIYRKLDAGGIQLPGNHVWIYQPIWGTYPNLDPAAVPDSDEFLPVVPIRHNNKDYTDAALVGTPLYDTSNRLLKKLGLSLTRFGELINENPSVADIDSAYVMFGVDMQTTFEPSLKFLVYFFERLYALQTTDEIGFYSQAASANRTDDPANLYMSSIKTAPSADAFKEYGLNLKLHFAYITSQSYAGSIGSGKVGAVTKAYGTYSYTNTIEVYDPENGVSTSQAIEVTKRTLILRLQSATGVVREVVVYNPLIYNYITDGKGVMTTLDDIIADPDNHNFIIPLQFGLVEDNFKLSEKQVLYADSCLMVINSWDEVVTKWYQKGAFKFIIMVVAIVITVWTGGAGAWLNALTVAAAGGIIALIQFLAMSFLVALAVSYAAKWIVTTLGEKFALLAVLVAIVVAVVLKNPGLLNNALREFTMVTAQHMMQVATALVSATNEFLVEEAEEIVDEYEQFKKELEGKYEELESLQDLLKNKSDLDPLLFTAPSRYKSIGGETPDQFYQRCLGLQDNTMFTIHDQIPHFHTLKLKLKKDVPQELFS